MPSTSFTNPKQAFDSQVARKPAPLETIAVAVSMAAIVAFIAVDTVRTAPADAAPIEVTFDVAPQTQWAPTPSSADEKWAADDSARGTRPDAIH